MAAGGEAFPPPQYYLDEEAEAYVDKVVGWLMNPRIRRRVFESGGKEPGFANSWKNLNELYTSEEISAILGGARDLVVFYPLKVVELVRATLIQEGIKAEEAEQAQIDQGRGKIDGVPAPSSHGGASARSGRKTVTGGNDQSKRIKIEALARLGHGEYAPSSQVRPLISVVDVSMGSGTPVVVPMIVGGCGTRSRPKGDIDRNVKDHPPPVCKNASMSVTAPLMDCGSNLADVVRSGLDVEVEKQDVAEGGDLVELGSNDKVVEAMYRPAIRLVESIGSATPMLPSSDPFVPVTDGESLAGCDGPVYTPAKLGSDEFGSTQPIFFNASLEAAALAQDFLPPALGVGLQEWVKVAKDSRKGKKSNASLGRDPAVFCASTVIDQVSGDPFPPLTRMHAGSAGARVFADSCGDGKLGNSKGGLPNVESKQNEVNNFSWQELLRTSKPADLGVDLHYVEPTMIDGEPCAVFTEEEEAENLKIWQHTLIFYVVGKSPSYFQFLKAVTRLWKPPGGVEVFMRENGLFYCRFACVEDMNRVIKDGPWYMEGKLVVVKKFVGATNCEETMLLCIPIWVKLPCLPVQWWSISGVSKVVSAIGQPLYFDVPSASQSRIAFARCCVEVAMDRDLPSWINCIGGDKVRRRQKIEYDWVPKKCSKCKMFGHLVADCNLVMNKDVAKMVVDQGKYKGIKQNSNFPTGLQQSEWENPKGTKNREEHRGAKEQSKLKMGMQDSMNKVSMLNNKCGGSIIATNVFQPLLNIDEEDSGVALSGGTLGKQACPDGDEPSVQHISKGAADTGIEEEGSGNEQVSETNKEGTHGMVDKEGISIPPCGGGGGGGARKGMTGNQGEIDSMIMEDSDYTKSNKKKKRIKKKSAPVRPEGSQTTRHSGNILIINE